MLVYFINAIYDTQIALLQHQIAAIGGTTSQKAGSATLPVGTSSLVITHSLGLPNAVGLTPNTANIAIVWGGGGYWISGKTNNSFQINLSVAAPSGGVGFDWMVMAV